MLVGRNAMKGDTALHEAVRACRGGFAAVAVFGFGINLLMLTIPLYMLQVYDRVLSSRSTETLIVLTLIAGAALLTLAALDAIRGYLLVRISNWLEQRVSGPLLAVSVSGVLRAGADPSVQSLRDLSTFRKFLAGPAIFPIMDAPWTPIYLVAIFGMHFMLGWIAVGGAIVLFSLAVVNEFATRKALRDAGTTSIAALRKAEAAIRNADVVEAMGMMPALIAGWQDANSKALSRQADASDRGGAVTAVSRFVRMLLQCGMLGTGAWLAINGEVTPGVMIAGSILLGRALAPVEQAIGSWKMGVSARAAWRRVVQHLTAIPLPEKAMALPRPEGLLEVEGLAFVHGQNEPIFSNVSFRLEPGEALGLIGPTASGKTTLARLIVGNLAPRAGTVRLDGANMATWNSEDRGRHIGYLPQDVELFDGKVNENIARMGTVDSDAVIAAAQLVDVHDMILRLPNGYETEIGPDGAALSGGQRQRIALARAVYGEPRLVVLDEPNASLDAEGEIALMQALVALKEQDMTVVVITHRPNILRLVDKVLLLHNGRVGKFGPREEVLPNLKGPTGDGLESLRVAAQSTARRG